MRLIRSVAVIVFVLALVAAAIAARRPLAFQKCAVIREAPVAEILPEGPSLDVAAFVGAIPYVDQTPTLYEVDPRAKYERAVREGVGNCSSLVFGTAFALGELGIDYQIVHVLPRRSFLDGAGHTVVRTRYRTNGTSAVGIVDVLEGGLPTSRGRALDIEHLGAGAVEDFAIRSLNPKKDATSDFYDSLLDTSTVGWIAAADVRRYFAFLERVHVPLGAPKLEKYLCDGAAVLLGFYPSIQVASLDATFVGVGTARRTQRAALFVLRVAFVLLPAYAILEVVGFVRRRTRARAPASIDTRAMH